MRLALTRLDDRKKVGRADKWRPVRYFFRREEGCGVDLARSCSRPHSPFGDFPRSRLSTGAANHGASGVGEGWRGEVRRRGRGARPSVIRYRPETIFSVCHEGWRAPPGPTSRMMDARTESRGGPRMASRPIKISAIHLRRRRHPRDTRRRHLGFSRREAIRRRRSRPRGFTRPRHNKDARRRPTRCTVRTRPSGNESTRRLEPPSR